MTLMLGNSPVTISRNAEIDRGVLRYRAKEVQGALDICLPLNQGFDEEESTLVLERGSMGLPVSVVERRPGDRVVWAFHAEHTARDKQPVPFVVCGDRPPLERTLSILVVNVHTQPRLVRLYTGEYRPPLPWQRSVCESSDQELINESREFWRSHAYVYVSTRIRGKESNRRPLWFNDFDLYLERTRQARRVA
ncbi:MAG: hypothetical protein WBP12_00635 [Candidatus Saccharimonas sp.]